MEELRRAWAGVLLGWWVPSGLWPYAAEAYGERQPNMPDIAARALVQGLDTPALPKLAGASASAEDTVDARELLSQVMVELGFTRPEPDATPWQRTRLLLSPDTAGKLEKWLAMVQHDVDAIHPSVGTLGLKLLPHYSLVVALPDGTYSAQGTDEIECWATNERPTLADVAHSAQDCLLDVLMLQWPECPEHDRMLIADGHEEQPVWTCLRGGGHPVARVSELTR